MRNAELLAQGPDAIIQGQYNLNSRGINKPCSRTKGSPALTTLQCNFLCHIQLERRDTLTPPRALMQLLNGGKQNGRAGLTEATALIERFAV